MSNDIKKTDDNPFLAYGNAATTRSITGTLLRFTKGDYVAGTEGDIPLGTQFIVDMDSLRVGWVCWRDNQPIDERMGFVADGFVPLKLSELPDRDKSLWEIDTDGEPKDPWQFTNYLKMNERETGEVYTFATSTKGGLGAIGELAKTYGEELAQHPNEWPIVELAVGSYRHRDRSIGKVKFPILNAIGWSDKEPPKPTSSNSPPPALGGNVAEQTGF
jgi:hypothetical protein